MKFGIFDYIDARGETLQQTYEDRLALLQAAEAAGFYGYHLTEHHATPLSMTPSPSVFLAAAARETQRIRLGTLLDGNPTSEVRLRQFGSQFFFEDRSEFSQQARTIASVGTPMLTGERRGIERCQPLQDRTGFGGMGVIVHRFTHRFAGREDFRFGDGSSFRPGLGEEVTAQQRAGRLIEQYAAVPAVGNMRRINPLPRFPTRRKRLAISQASA